MLTEEDKAALRAKLEKVSQSLGGYSPRAGQRKMIAEISKIFAGGGAADPKIGCINGGTGIGKSLGYCIAGSTMATRRGKKLVISTATIALQEQLLEKELPLVVEAGTRVAVSKGRSRYLCNYRLHKAIKADETPVLRDMCDALESGKWDGDRDHWASVPDTLWSGVTCEGYGCLGNKCPLRRDCTQFRARARVQDADIIITNHDLLLSDLALGGDCLLPAPNRCFLIVDEGHRLPRKAIEAFARHHSLRSSVRSLKRLQQLGALFSTHWPEHGDQVAQQVSEYSAALIFQLDQLVGYLECLEQLKPSVKKANPKIEFVLENMPDEFWETAPVALASCQALRAALAVIRSTLEDAPAPAGKDIDLHEILIECGRFEKVLQEIHETWSLLQGSDDPKAPPIAKWIASKSVLDQVEFTIHASPVLPGSHLHDVLWKATAGTIMTSASISVLGKFDPFVASCGLEMTDVSCLNLPSPFDYEKQAVLEIPELSVTPTNVVVHTNEVFRYVESVLKERSKEGRLVLFTSRKQMEAVYSRLPESLQGDVLMQSNTSKGAMLAEHKRRIDRGQPSAIFGLKSFSEGVDLQGQYCTLLIKTKLPFAAPDDPVTKAHCEWLRAQNRDPFKEIVLPEAARDLEQATGRLIRTVKDHGKIVILDTRLWNTNYGRQMLQSLPPFKLIVNGKPARIKRAQALPQ